MKYVILIIGVLSINTAIAQWTPQKAKTTDTLLQMYADAKQFSGVVLIAQGEDILFQRAIGFADREKQINNTLSTNFNIASAGKTFTATLIMQLVQEGKLRLSQTIDDFLPGDSIKNAKLINIEHLLTHTSGIGNYMMNAGYKDNYTKITSLSMLMPFVKEQEPTLNFPGEHFDYSNSGYIILGRIIEKITGLSYIDNLKQRIFVPAGIKNTHIHYPATFNAPDEAVPYYAYTQKSYINVAKEEFPGFSDGGMQTNVADLLRFTNGIYSKKLLNRQYIDSMWKGRQVMGRDGKYGFGWIENINHYGKTIVSHDGGSKGFSSDIKMVKEDGFTIIVLINNGQVNPREVSDNILSIIYTSAYNKPVKYFETVLMEINESKGFDYIINSYKDILKGNGFEKTPSPWVYVQFNDMLLSLGETDKALVIQEMGRKEFPMETSMYNITGVYYMNKNNHAEAEIWFKKALAIDPNDGFALMMLQNLKK